MENVFFQSWESLVRTAVVGVMAYVALVLILRITGNRSLSQLNAFDLIVTVALGSTLATVILNANVALADGLVALLLLAALQFMLSKLSVRYRAVRYLIKTEPRLLFFKGRYLRSALNDCRITEEEILQVIRLHGMNTISEVDAVVLESNGKFSVIRNISGDEEVLRNVGR